MERAFTRTAFGATDRIAGLAGCGRGASSAGGLSRSLVDELFTGSAEQRARAAARIEAVLGLAAVGPLCEALATETEPEVLAAICASLGRLGLEETYEDLRPHLASEEPAVRAAAIEACLRLVRAEPERSWLVEIGLGDTSACVRRRTFLAAAALPGFELVPLALRCRADGDPHVRRLAYVALASESDPAVACRAFEAISDPDEGVRRAVAPLLARRFGADAEALASLSPAERLREIRALEARAKEPERRDPALESGRRGPAPEAELRRHAPTGEFERGGPAPKPELRGLTPVGKFARRGDALAAAPAATDAAEPGIPFDEIELVLMTSLRGATLPELVERLRRGEADVARAVERYLAEGRLVLRGSRLYLP